VGFYLQISGGFQTRIEEPANLPELERTGTISALKSLVSFNSGAAIGVRKHGIEALGSGSEGLDGSNN
jgi:hypothetical protein